MKKLNRFEKGLLIFSILLIPAIYFSQYVIFMDTEKVCAKVKREAEGKHGKSLIYFYKYKGEIYEGSFNSKMGISLRLDMYKDKECLEVEVSTLFPSQSRVVVTKPEKKKYKQVFD